jgi:hypothetical protein
MSDRPDWRIALQADYIANLEEELKKLKRKFTDLYNEYWQIHSQYMETVGKLYVSEKNVDREKHLGFKNLILSTENKRYEDTLERLKAFVRKEIKCYTCNEKDSKSCNMTCYSFGKSGFADKILKILEGVDDENL